MGYYHELYPCVLSIVKFTVPQTTLQNFFGNYVEILNAVVAYVIIAAIIIIFVPWYVLRKLLDLALKIHHGDNYGGMLNGVDRVCNNDIPKPMMIVVYILEHDGNIQELYNDVKMACVNLFNSHIKFSSVIKQTLGYHYYVGHQYNIDDLISIQECTQDSISKTDLTKYLDDKYMTSLNDAKLWEVLIFNKPMANKNYSTRTCYPVIIRTNHAVCDGINLCIFHQKYMMNKKINEHFIHAMKKSQNTNFNLKRIHNFVKYTASAASDYDMNAQNSKRISSLYMEEKPKYLNMIKEIKNKAKVTFTDVFVTAAACSLRDYIIKKSCKIDKISFGATCRPITEDTDKLLSGSLLANHMTFLTNILNISKLDVPISVVLKEYARTLNSSKNSADSQVLYLIIKLCEHLPHQMFLKACRLFRKPILLAVTNVPSIQSGYINNHYIQDAFVYLNNFNNISFMYQLHSYNGRLQVNVTAKEDTVNTREELDDILINTFVYIDKLYDEVVER